MSEGNAALNRRTFEVSRGLEYFTESELQMQIGAGREAWPVAILKELVDNALDAAETAELDPEVRVELTPDGFSVEDNGPGLPASTIERSLDYTVRVSDKLGYVAPTRGRLGNALKVVWAAPFVDMGFGEITVRTRGRLHAVNVTVDRLEQKPAIRHEVSANGNAAGTKIALAWPDSACLLNGTSSHVFYKRRPPTAVELVDAFAAFNPHATLHLNGDTILPTAPGWKKWMPSSRLVPHWYTPETFRELVANYVASERYGAEPITVREFVSGFRGLTSTAKQKTVTKGFSGDYLHELAVGGDLDHAALGELLGRMQDASRPPKPAALGVIGAEHLVNWMVTRAGVSEESVQYRRKVGDDDGMPYVVEIAFGVSADDEAGRRIVTGLNWSPTLDVPAREIQSILQEMRVDSTDPVVVVIHMVRPSWRYTGRGKETVSL